MLQRLEIFEVLHHYILDGSSDWDCFFIADFSILEYIKNPDPQEVAELLTNDDVSCCRKFCSADFLSLLPEGPFPKRLRNVGTKWTTLFLIVKKLCINAFVPVERITGTAKVNLCLSLSFVTNLVLNRSCSMAETSFLGWLCFKAFTNQINILRSYQITGNYSTLPTLM
jgi:hypothetical protein